MDAHCNDKSREVLPEDGLNVCVGTIYRHYKGNLYKVLAIGHHSETEEKMVVYEGQYNSKEFGNNPIWIRPFKIFVDRVVNADNEIVRRFTAVPDQE